MGLLRVPLAVALLALASAVPSVAANAVVGHSVSSDEDGVQLDLYTADHLQRAYVRADTDGWVGAGTHDAAANGAGAHVGTETTVGYGLGAWWCDAGLHADEPDLVYSRGTECWGYECLDEGGYAVLAAYVLAHPEDYLDHVTTYGTPC
jgi:hypothetical protein